MPLPKKILGYDVKEKIGAGGFSTIYRAEKEGASCAVKIMRTPPGLAHEQVLEMMRYEFWVLKDIRHPNIITVYDFGSLENGDLFLIMEYCRGMDLREFCQKNIFSACEPVLIAAMQGLRVLHEWRISHGDIKAQNILVIETPAGPTAKILDFGLAKLWTPTKVTGVPQARSHVPGHVSGTPGTMAPEVVLGEAATTKSDLYSLGVTFYDALTGKNPFIRKDNLAATLKNHLTFLPDPVGMKRGDVPPVWTQLIQQLMAKKPDERPASLMQALQGVSAREFLPTPPAFIGRSAELGCVNQIHEALVQDRPLAIVVNGPLGVGVRHFLREVLFLVITHEPTARPKMALEPATDPLNRPILLIARREAPGGYPTRHITLTPFSREEVTQWLLQTYQVPKVPTGFLERMIALTGALPQLLKDVTQKLAEAHVLTDANGHVTPATLELIDWEKIYPRVQTQLSEDFDYVLESTQARVRRRNLAIDDPVWDLLDKLGAKSADKSARLQRRARALQLQGAVLIDASRFDEAHEKLKTSLEIFGSDAEHGDDTIRTRNYLAYVLLRQGQIQKAISLYEQSREEAKRLPESLRRQVLTNLDLGFAYLEAQRFGDAVAQCRVELSLMDDITPAPRRLSCLYNLALACAALKEHAEAVTCFEQVITLAREAREPQFLLRGMNGLANSLSRSDDWQKALPHYSEALELSLALKDYGAAAAAALNRGLIRKRQNDAHGVLTDGHAALKYIHKIKPRYTYENRLECLIQTRLGEACLEMGREIEAREMLENAWKIVETDEALKAERFGVLVARCHLWQKTNDTARFKEDAAALHFYAGKDPEKLAIYQSLTRQELADDTISAPLNPDFQSDGLKRVLAITRDLAGELPLDELMKKILDYAVELTRAELGVILTCEANGILKPYTSLNASLDDDLSEISLSVAQKAVATGAVVRSENAAEDKDFNQFASVMHLSLKSILGLPIRFKGKTLGVLYLSHRLQPGLFDDDTVELARTFADQAGIALKNHELLAHYRKTTEHLEDELQGTRADLVVAQEALLQQGEHTWLKLGKHELLTKSAALRQSIAQAQKLATTTIPVVIQGESGSGKELLAHVIHHASVRRDAPFVAINCGALPQNLVESELFGHKKGAFTGADQDKIGLIEAAHGGTLFLDEIIDLPTDTQVKLLRVLQEKEITRLGDTQPKPVDVRVIAASHKSMTEAVAKKVFREDLYYRLAGMEIIVPPLRQRPEDIPVLARHFLKALAENPENKKMPRDFSAAFLKLLVDYSWPGNVRELKNVVDVVATLTTEKILKPNALPQYLKDRLLAPMRPRFDETARSTAGWYHPRLTWKEHELLVYASALIALDFDIAQTAISLGVGTATVYKWLRDNRIRELKSDWEKKVLHYEKGLKLEEIRKSVFAAAASRHVGHPYHAAKELNIAPVTFYRYTR